LWEESFLQDQSREEIRIIMERKVREVLMKNGIRLVLGVVMVFALSMTMSSCASAPKQTGFLGDYYKKLGPGPEGGVKERWVKPGVDFSKYNKVMLDGVVFYFARDAEDKGIDPDQMKELSDAFNKELVNALKDKYPIVTEPGPDVVRIKIALTGIKQSRPVLSGVTTVVPVGLAVSTIKRGTGGSWAGSGATSAEMMAIDTTNNEVIVVARDEQTAGFTKRFSKYGSADEAFKFWAGRMRAFLDQAHGVQPK
jgi:hypothetical protein